MLHIRVKGKSFITLGEGEMFQCHFAQCKSHFVLPKIEVEILRGKDGDLPA
jgi:hypothetical protein